MPNWNTKTFNEIEEEIREFIGELGKEQQQNCAHTFILGNRDMFPSCIKCGMYSTNIAPIK